MKLAKILNVYIITFKNIWYGSWQKSTEDYKFDRTLIFYIHDSRGLLIYQKPTTCKRLEKLRGLLLSEFSKNPFFFT